MKVFTIFFIAIFLLPLNVLAQNQKIVLDAVSMLPIEAANAVILKSKKGISINIKGEFSLNVSNLIDTDTIAITHINYHSKLVTVKQFKQTDTFFLSPKTYDLGGVIITNETNIEVYKKKNIFGFFYNAQSSGITGSGMRTGIQLGVKMENQASIKGILSSVSLHFDKLAPNVRFRLRIKKINPDGTIGDDLIKNGIEFTPKNKRPRIYIKEHKIFFPPEGLFICIDHLGDGNIYNMALDEPLSILRLTHRYNKALTYDNYRETGWSLFFFTWGGKPTNAQIQLTVLSKK